MTWEAQTAARHIAHAGTPTRLRIHTRRRGEIVDVTAAAKPNERLIVTAAEWHVVSKHLFRRTAQARKKELARRENGQMPRFRVSPKRWKGYWRVEELVRKP